MAESLTITITSDALALQLLNDACVFLGVTGSNAVKKEAVRVELIRHIRDIAKKGRAGATAATATATAVAEVDAIAIT